MKNIFFLFVVGAFFSGCSASEVVVRDATQQNKEQPRQEAQEVMEITAQVPEVPQTEQLPIVDLFVDWGYTAANRGRADIDTVIIHSVYNPFVQQERYDLDEILTIFEGYGVAPHYIITRDGQVHYVVQEKDVAYHAGRSRTPDGRSNLNNFSLGIEMINSLDDQYTPEQYEALRKLLETIKEKYTIKYVLGHDEIAVEDPWNFDWSQINDLRHEER